MSRREEQVKDEYGNLVPGAKVYVFDRDGNDAAIYADEAMAVQIEQPVVADEFGVFSYYAEDHMYREDTHFAGKLRFREIVGVGNPPELKGDPGGNIMAIGLFLAASALTIPTGTDVVRTAGYQDKGAGIADYVADAAVDAAFVAANPLTSFISANARGFRLAVNGHVNVQALGARTASADNRAPIQAAMDAVGAAGGGLVEIPAGTFLCGKSPSGAYVLRHVDGVYLIGQGQGVSVIKRADGTGGAQVFSATNFSNIGLLRLTLDGNRDNNVNAGHCFRLGGGRGCLVQDVKLRNAVGYGGGIQDGANHDCEFTNLTIENVGADGFDIKNKGVITLAYDGGTAAITVGDRITGASSGTTAVVSEVDGDVASGTLTLIQETDALHANYFTNNGQAYQDFTDGENLQVGGVTKAAANGMLERTRNSNIRFTNLTVNGWGLNTSETKQAALDLRGDVVVTGVHASNPGNFDSIAVRGRQGEQLWINGTGAHQSQVTGIVVELDTGAMVNGSANRQNGLYSAARNLLLTGAVEGGDRCVFVIESGNKLDLRVNRAVREGILASASTDDPGLTPHKTVLKPGTRATNCGGDGIKIEANDCELVAVQAESNTGYGLNIAATANRTKVNDGLYGTSNTAGRINDSGVASRIRVDGFHKIYTFAQLATHFPSPVEGDRAFVTDLSVSTYGTAAAGGGANRRWTTYISGAWVIG